MTFSKKEKKEKIKFDNKKMKILSKKVVFPKPQTTEILIYIIYKVSYRRRRANRVFLNPILLKKSDSIVTFLGY